MTLEARIKRATRQSLRVNGLFMYDCFLHHPARGAAMMSGGGELGILFRSTSLHSLTSFFPSFIASLVSRGNHLYSLASHNNGSWSASVVQPGFHRTPTATALRSPCAMTTRTLPEPPLRYARDHAAAIDRCAYSRNHWRDNSRCRSSLHSWHPSRLSVAAFLNRLARSAPQSSSSSS